MVTSEKISLAPYEPPCRIAQSVERASYRRGKNPEINGFAMLRGLPVYFRAWQAFPKPRILEGVQNEKSIAEAKTNWSPHAPYNPLEVMNMNMLSDEEKRHLWGRLGYRQEDFNIGGLTEVLEEKRPEYDALKERYFNDKFLRRSFSAAISLICDEIEGL